MSMKINECFALTLKGDSMSPDFLDGDIVVVDPTVQPRPGDFVVAKRESRYFDGIDTTFKKYRPKGYNDNGLFIFELIPLNEDYPVISSEKENIEIVGVMIEHRRKYHRHL